MCFPIKNTVQTTARNWLLENDVGSARIVDVESVIRYSHQDSTIIAHRPVQKLCAPQNTKPKDENSRFARVKYAENYILHGGQKIVRIPAWRTPKSVAKNNAESAFEINTMNTNESDIVGMMRAVKPVSTASGKDAF
jgi:hypothetical protein